MGGDVGNEADGRAAIAAPTVRAGRPRPIAEESVALGVVAARGARRLKLAEVMEWIERLYTSARRTALTSLCVVGRLGWRLTDG